MLACLARAAKPITAAAQLRLARSASRNMLSSKRVKNMLACLARAAKPITAAAQLRLARSASRNMLSSKRVKNGGKGYALLSEM